MTTLLSFLQYDKWANDRTLQYLRDAANLDADALKRFQHILFAQSAWMNRLKGRDGAPAQVEGDLDDAAELLQKLYDEYLEFVSWMQEDELDSIIAYKDLKGNPHQQRVRDILMHVFNHGTYHRGQISYIVRNEGDVPMATDYIVMVREKDASEQS